MTRANDDPSPSWTSRLPLARRYGEHAAAILLSVAFALGLNPDYGVDNQVVYMLGSLSILDPSLYGRDWVVHHNTHYHKTFEYVAAAFIALDRGGKGILVASIIAVVAGFWALYALVRSLAPKAALPAFATLLLLAFATHTRGPAATYVFDHILQPSTLGSVGLLFGALYFARGRFFASGLGVAFAGLFHGNYMILLYGAAIMGHASLGGRGLAKRLALQLAAPTVVLLMLLPVILHTAHSPDSARAQEIYANIRAPHHFQLARSLGDFLPLVGWLLCGLGGAALLRPGHESDVRRLLAFAGGLSFMVFGGATASVLFHNSAATQLFSWRIAPHVALISQALMAAGIMRVAVSPSEIGRVPSGSVFAFATGGGLLALHYGAKNEPNIAYAALAFIGAAVLAAVAVYVGRVVLERRPSLSPSKLVTGVSTFAYVAATAGPAYALVKSVEPTVRALPERSTIFHGIGKDERELCEFMRTKTPKDALFISPPNIETLRFHGERAIIADWKSNPIVPSELLEWYRRMGELTGRPRFGGWGDLGGYEGMDAARLATLVKEYQPDYVIVTRGRAPQLGCYATAFENPRFTVVDLHKPCAVPAPLGRGPVLRIPDERDEDPR